MELHRAWILEGWERAEDDGPFVFAEKMRRFYDFDGEGVVIHDSFDPEKRVARSAAEYGRFFEAPFNAMLSARHIVSDGPHVIVGRDLAASSLEFLARLEGLDGTVVGIRAQSQTVWRCTKDGWRIVREQNAVDEFPLLEIEQALLGGISPITSLIVEGGVDGRKT